MNNDTLISQSCSTIKRLKTFSDKVDESLGRLATYNAIFFIDNAETAANDPKIDNYKGNLKSINELTNDMLKTFHNIQTSIDSIADEIHGAK